MLMAEQLALVAIDPDSGHHQLGTRDGLNATLAGLLIAELALAGTVGPGDAKATIVPIGRPAPDSAVLAAAHEVIADKGPKVKAVLST
jgi:hypothetical protein